MQGLLHVHVPLLARRLVTLIPALVILVDRRRPDPRAGAQSGGAVVRHPVRADPAGAVHRRGARCWATPTNRWWTTALAVVAAVLLVALNVTLIVLLVPALVDRGPDSGGCQDGGRERAHPDPSRRPGGVLGRGLRPDRDQRPRPDGEPCAARAAG